MSEHRDEIAEMINRKKANSSLERADGSTLYDNVAFSMAYIILSRCGKTPDGYGVNFIDISRFDTVSALSVLGHYAADFSKSVLMEIGKVIEIYNRKNLQKFPRSP